MAAARSGPSTVRREGRPWPVGTDAEVAWIAQATSPSQTITAAIPPVFDAYATILLPDGGAADRDRRDRAVLALLAENSGAQTWWLGYAAGRVFAGVPVVAVYGNWQYSLVQAGPQQAASWDKSSGAASVLPDLIFPADRSWLLSTLWDDDWTCIGGPRALVDALIGHPDLKAREVVAGEEATPPGHRAV